MLSHGAPPEPGDGRDLAVVVDGLSRFLGGRFRSLPPAEIADIASESIVRLLQTSQAGRLDENRPAGPYLTRIAHNLAVTRLRRPITEDLDGSPGGVMDDDALARLLDARASSERLRQALARAARAGDHMLLRVVREWLRLAEQRSTSPSSRAVAERLDISHTTVNEALARLREYLPD